MRSKHVDTFERRQRRLPHWEGPGESYFLTFVLRRPPVVDLSKPDVAPTIIGALRFLDKDLYWLYDYTVMPDHVHAIIQPIVEGGKTPRLHDITRRLKSWTARKMNDLLGRSGPVWQTETYDHVIRNQADYDEKATYIHNNPHTAGLVPFGEEWPWWGCGPQDP